MNIENATPQDIGAIKRILNQWKNELGFVNRSAVLDRIAKCNQYSQTC